MSTIARRVGIAFGSFVIAWVVITLVARWLFGSGNVLVWVLAAIVGAAVYSEVRRRDRSSGYLGTGGDPRRLEISATLSEQRARGSSDVILHPSQEVILSPLRYVVGVGRVVDVAGVSVELLAVEVREAGALLYLRATPVRELMLFSAAVAVTDDRGTAYRALDAGHEGSAVHWSGQSVVIPAPPPGARLSVEVESFGPPRDHPMEFRSETVTGPWRFDLPSLGA